MTTDGTILRYRHWASLKIAYGRFKHGKKIIIPGTLEHAIKELISWVSSAVFIADGEVRSLNIFECVTAKKTDDLVLFNKGDLVFLANRDPDYIPGKPSSDGTYVPCTWRLKINGLYGQIQLANDVLSDAPSEGYVNEINFEKSGKPGDSSVECKLWWKRPGRIERFGLIELRASYNGWKDKMSVEIRGRMPSNGEKCIEYSYTGKPLPWEVEIDDSLPIITLWNAEDKK